MTDYALRAVHRRPDGVIGPTLAQHLIPAPDDATAIAKARALDQDLAAVGANAVYLAAPDARVIWSLHRPGDPAAEGQD